MDWIKDLDEKFGADPEISQMATRRMHGSVTINFCDGQVVNYNLTIHRRADALYYTANAVYTLSTSANVTPTSNSTSTKGE